MSDWLAGLGAGMQTLGSTGLQYLLQEQERKRQEELLRKQDEKERKALERAGRERDQQFQQFAFQNNLMPYDQAEAPVREFETMGRGISAGGRARAGTDTGGMIGMGMAGNAVGQVGDMLSELAKKSRARLEKGRTMDYTDAQGKTVKYYQPYEKTEEGRREQEITRGVQALMGAGFSKEESQAIMQSPEKLQSALIERLRPKATPQRVVGPDGTVSFVTPPANMGPAETYTVPGVKANVSVPGQSPYNWTLDTDDETGTRVLVDPRTGQTKPVMTPSGEPMRNTPDNVKRRANAIATMEAALNRYEELVKQSGLEIMPGEGKARLESARVNLQIPWKTYAELGALSGPDLGLVIDAVGDATSINAIGGSAKGILAKLNEARRALNKEKQLFSEMYKVPIPGQGTAPAGQQLSPQEQAIYDAAKAEGKTDAEIMAFIVKMRGGSL